MKESLFIKQNKQKWKDLEKHLASEQTDPDKLSDLFIQVSDDLSYARTFYPNRSVRLYLNNLAQKVYSNIYKSRRSRWSDIVFFWKEELPKIVWESRKELSISMFVFVLAVSIGVFSAIQDANFVRLILGNEYVDMTIENIQKGDPMAVYKQSEQADMFLRITRNNIRIDFLTFAAGIFLGIGSILIMFYNGIMVGVFQYFFIQKGVFVESALTIWLHGTLEMAGMVLAGAAGIRLGSGLVFPGTYSRIQSFQRSSMHAFKLLMGTIPITFFAAVIESFLTRYTETPDIIRFLLIVVSLLFIVGYFIVFPVFKSRKGFSPLIKQHKVIAQTYTRPDQHSISSDTDLIRVSFSMFHHFFFSYGWIKFLFLSLSCSLITYSLYYYLPEYNDLRAWLFFTNFFDPELPLYIHAAHIANLSLILYITGWIAYTQSVSLTITSFRFWLKHYYKAFILAALLYPLVLIDFNLLICLAIAGITPVALLIYMVSLTDDINLFASVSRTFNYLTKQYLNVVALFCMLCLFMVLYYIFIESPITFVFIELILFNIQTDPETLRWINIGFYTTLYYGGIYFLLPLTMYGTMWKLFSLKEIKSAGDLTKKIHSIWQ
ncbi:MAG: stage II sporulation protein M [Cytophagales bacterium]|nr:stage II sporulation protein M [Cytophaga sp.]